MVYVVMKVLMGFWCSLALLLMVAFGIVHGGSVTYDRRSLIIDGQHKILFSGSIHYPRSTPKMWSDLIAKAKEGGLDVIDTYVFWNLHEPHRGLYKFNRKRNIVRFIQEIQSQGLYVILRIGPFIESEWTYGGLPFWLHDIPGITFRTDNEPFKFYMQNFTAKIVNMMKSANLFASQGGPIILSQIENEYSLVEGAFHKNGVKYIRWAAKMAVGLQTGVPWVMCRQDDAPDLVINTCNGLRCGETFKGPNSPNKPSLWTENWTSRYPTFGEKTRLRSAEDIAYNVALFIAKNGSFVNYYMYHGGTNFDRTASAFVTTAYYDDAPLDEYGLVKQPKWGHLKELHTVIKNCSEPLLYGTQTTLNLGAQQEAYVFKKNSTSCVAFLGNSAHIDATIQFQNVTYQLPRQSISILPDCKNVAFNTAKVNTQHLMRAMKSQLQFNSAEKWKVHIDAIPNYVDTSLRENKVLDHFSITKDTSDYLWYTSSIHAQSPNTQSVLSAFSRGHVLYAFVNGVLVGSTHGSIKNTHCNLEIKINLGMGENNISLLSATVGLPDSGAHLEHKTAGLYDVKVDGRDLTSQSWGYQVGLLGEKLKIYTSTGLRNVYWGNLGNFAQPLTWYQTTFDAPAGNDPVALNLGSMGKGQIWVNEHNIGRYWVSFHTHEGTPTQQWYHIPRSFLKPAGNLLVLLEEEKGNPLGITLDTAVYTMV